MAGELDVAISVILAVQGLGLSCRSWCKPILGLGFHIREPKTKNCNEDSIGQTAPKPKTLHVRSFPRKPLLVTRGLPPATPRAAAKYEL